MCSMLEEEIKKKAHMVDEHIQRYFEGQSTPRELYRACTHYIDAGGKRLRPALLMLASELCGGEDDPLACAAAVELIHTFTLIHDDIMDNDEMRRGVPTVHTLWGEAGAILAGDTLYSKAFEMIAGSSMNAQKRSECMGVLSRTCTEICEGQWIDIDISQREGGVGEQEYLDMVERKTAVLYGAAAEVGGIVGGATPEQRRALYDFGRLSGIAFQVQDDVLDITAPQSMLGKDAMSDIREGKMTLIAIHALSHGVRIPAFKKADATPEELQSAVEVLDRAGSIQYAKDVAQRYLRMGCSKLDVFEESKPKRMMLELAEFLVSRGY
ncbi:MAG: polyprenyl synthetase family protein [Methermicoccaceae archaeon]